MNPPASLPEDWEERAARELEISRAVFDTLPREDAVLAKEIAALALQGEEADHERLALLRRYRELRAEKLKFIRYILRQDGEH